MGKKNKNNNQQQNSSPNNQKNEAQKSIELEKLQKQGEELKNKNEELRNQNDELVNKNKELNKQNEELRKQSEDLNKNCQKIEAKYNEAKETIQNAKKQEQEALTHAEEVRKNADEMKEQIKLATEDLANLEKKIENAQKQSDDLKRQNEVLRNENQTLQDKNSDFQKEYSSIQADLTNAQRTIWNAREEARKILKSAENEATELKEEARTEAIDRENDARNKAEQFIKDAYHKAEKIEKDALDKAETLTKESLQKKDELLKNARKEAEQLVTDAHNETMSVWEKENNDLEQRRNEIQDARIELQKNKDEFEQYRQNEELSIQQRKQELENKFQEKEQKLEEEYERKKLKVQEEQKEALKNFKTQQENLNIEKEAIKEAKDVLAKQKERYDKANPEQLASLQADLDSEKTKYNELYNRYQEQTTKLQECQLYMDRIKTEVKNPDDENGSSYTMNEVITRLQEYRKENEQLKKIQQDFPNYEDIEVLKQKANKAEALEHEKSKLEEECHYYQSEQQNYETLRRTNEQLQKSIDTNKVLNDNLLKEMKSVKSALENHTGDTCPALSKVDAETEKDDFKDDIKERTNRSELTTLIKIVSHVKNYAGNKELYYTDNDIRAFLAGMAVSRLIILQGMSGTGKSSLPEIFAESISGFNRLIPVESSWRDRNELLGYYNDFNKKFNAKSFTIELYRSSKELCQKIPTFITLDEMNLARIEYYFSDFLAILQKTKPEDWLIDLVSSDMRTLPMELSDTLKEKMRQQDSSLYDIWKKIQERGKGNLEVTVSEEEEKQLFNYLAGLKELIGAKDLIDGRKIKVTENIWFVGTANKDESTFEITDKVYDRAQVVSLNEKGHPESKYTPTPQKYISVATLSSLFEKAKEEKLKEIQKEVEARLQTLDNCLIKEFDTSFGNRILNQSIEFASVFVVAGGTLTNALDYQISTKILRKVITSDDKDSLLELQKIVTEYPKTKKIVDKRIKDYK